MTFNGPLAAIVVAAAAALCFVLWVFKPRSVDTLGAQPRMTFLEFLDRWGDRRSKRDPVLHVDAKTLIGAGFIFGYYFLVYCFMTSDIPDKTVGLVRDAMLVLGPLVGAIINSIFRESAADVAARASSGAALRTLAANSGTGDGTTANTTGGDTT